ITFTPTQTASDTPTPTCNSTCNTYTPTFSWTPTPTFTNSPTSSTTNTATPTPSSTPTQTTTNTPYPTPAVAPVSWSYSSQFGHISYTSYNGGEIFYGYGNNSIISYTNLTGGNNNFFETPYNYGAGPGTFTEPRTAVADSSGNIYVSDVYDNYVQKLNNTGAWVWTQGVTTAGSGVSQFSYPFGMDLDASGHLFVADANNNRIVELSASTGAWITSWSGSGLPSGQSLDYPEAIAIDKTNNYMYVGNFGNGGENDAVFKFDLSGNYQNSWGGSGCACPFIQNAGAVAVNPSGTRIYVADIQNQFVETFDSGGNFLNQWGQSGSSAGNYVFGASGSESPYGLAVDSNGKIYVADDSYFIIHVFTGPS
ncbi:MAG TPA: NHL repeat-containing protein, partial [bacterium]|nr:NHL repeat-containing protein [bacterium]